MTKPLKPATETAKPATLDYSTMKAPVNNTPVWAQKWKSTPSEEKRAFQSKLIEQRQGVKKSDSQPEGAVEGSLKRWKNKHLAKKAPEEHKEASTIDKDFKPSKEPITIEDGYKKRNIKMTADKGQAMLRALRSAKASGSMSKSENLSKAGAFRKKPVRTASQLLDKWKKKAAPMASIMKSDYNTEVNKKAEAIKNAHKEPKEPSLNAQVAEMKEKYKMKKSDSQPPQLDPTGVASIQNAFMGKSEDSALARWKAKHKMSKSAMPGTPKMPKVPSVKAVGAPPMQKAESNFKKLEHKLEAEGKTKEQAGGIAYKVGVEKYGKKGMEAKAKAGMNKSWEVEGEVPMEKSTGHEKGVHAPFNGEGRSRAGSQAVKGKMYNEFVKEGAERHGTIGIKEHERNAAGFNKKAKEGHKKVLNEMKAMKKPDLGKSDNMAAEGLEKARVDSGKPTAEKVAARQQRNDRDIKTTKTPAGQNTRTYQSGKKRRSELEGGAEPRKGEKIVGKPKDAARQGSSVHHRGNDYGADKQKLGAPVSADKNGKTYRTSHPHGPKAAHADIMEHNKMLKKPDLGKSEEEFNDTPKAGKGWTQWSKAQGPGDKVIGKTQSNKNVHANPIHKNHSNFTAEDHDDAAELHNKHADYHEFHGNGGEARKHGLAALEHRDAKKRLNFQKKPDLGKSDDLSKSEWKSPAHACHGKLAVMLNKLRKCEPMQMSDDGQPDMASEQLTEIAHHLQEILATGALGDMNDEMKEKLTLANEYLSELAHHLEAEPELHGALTDLVHNGPQDEMNKDMDAGMDQGTDPNMGGM